MEAQVIANIGSFRAVILGNNTGKKKWSTLRLWLHFIKISSENWIGLENLNCASDAIKENYVANKKHLHLGHLTTMTPIKHVYVSYGFLQSEIHLPAV